MKGYVQLSWKIVVFVYRIATNALVVSTIKSIIADFKRTFLHQ